EGARVADAERAVNPNYAPAYAYRSIAESALGQFEQAKSDVQQAMRLSPRDPRMELFHSNMADADSAPQHFESAMKKATKRFAADKRPIGLSQIWPPRTRPKATSTRR